MKRALVALMLAAVGSAAAGGEPEYLVMAFAWPGGLWDRTLYVPDEQWRQSGRAKVISDIQEMLEALDVPPHPRRLVAFSCTIAPLDRGDDAVKALDRLFDVSEALDVPLYIEVAAYTWWQTRKDLWSDPANVEWTGWTADAAMKSARRNWGKPFTVAPHPFLASPAYRNAVAGAITPMARRIASWVRHLDAVGRSYLFAGMDMDDEINPLNFAESDEAIEAKENRIFTHWYLFSHGGDPMAILPPKPEGVSRADWLTSHASWRPDDFTDSVVECFRGYLTWQAGVWKAAGVPGDKMYIHSVPDLADGTRMSAAALVPGVRPGWSVYPGYEPLDAMIEQFSRALEASGWPPWAVSEFLMWGSRREIASTIERLLAALPNNRIFLVQNWDNGVRRWLASDDPAEAAQGEAFLAALRKALL